MIPLRMIGLAGAGLLIAGTPSAAGTLADGPVQLRRASPDATGVEHLPTVRPGAAVGAMAADRINAALRREDARAVAAAGDCRRSLRGPQGKPSPQAWTRSVAVTMAGPRYLAYRVTDSYYCGGPYPTDGLRSDYVYDLATGKPVSWLGLFPAGAGANAGTSGDGAELGLIVWPELTRRAAALAGDECQDAFHDTAYAGFTIGLDAQSGTLTAQPAAFPHVVQACAQEVRLDLMDLRRLGFAPRLIAAIDAAHRLR